MSDRIGKKELIKQIAFRMDTDESVAAKWFVSVFDTLYENIKQGRSVSLTGFGGFYIQPNRPTWIFWFNPVQKLKALFGWSSSYKGKI